MRLLREILDLIDDRDRWKLAGVTVLLFFGSVFEIAGIGIILPYLKIVGEPELLLADVRCGPWLRTWGLDDPQRLIISASVALLAFMVIKGAYLLASLWITYGFVYRQYVTLTSRLLESYLRAPYTFHLQHNTAVLVRNVTIEVEHVAGILKYLVQLPTEFIVVFGLGVLLFVTQPGATLVGVLLLGGVSWGLTAVTRRRLNQYSRVRSVEHGQIIQWVNQGLGSVKEIKVGGREDFFVGAAARCGSRYAEAQRKSTFLSQYPRHVVEMMAGLSLVGLVVILIATAGNVRQLVPVLALFGIALVRLIPSVTRILSAINTIRYYSSSVHLIRRDLKGLSLQERSTANVSEVKPSLALRSSLVLEKLKYAYPESPDAALEDISVTIKRGQKVAFVGASGAGKTTLINLVLGLLNPSGGRILVDGADIAEDLAGWQRQIGYIPQDIYVLDDTIRRNVAFGLPDAEINDAAIWRALEAAQLISLVRDSKQGLDASVGERGMRISAGQRQRVAIARALYHDPDVLVLDEATSALDNETERQFAAAIDRLPRSKTLLMIAHRLSTVLHCDCIFVLEKGRLAAAGTYDELITTSTLFHRLVSVTDDRTLVK